MHVLCRFNPSDKCVTLGGGINFSNFGAPNETRNICHLQSPPTDKKAIPGNSKPFVALSLRFPFRMEDAYPQD